MTYFHRPARNNNKIPIGFFHWLYVFWSPNTIGRSKELNVGLHNGHMTSSPPTLSFFNSFSLYLKTLYLKVGIVRCVPKHIFLHYSMMFCSIIVRIVCSHWKFQKEKVHFKFPDDALKGVIGCPFSTSWYDSLGSWWKVYNILWLKFLNGSVKYTFFTLSKSAVRSSSLFKPMLL